jgi:2-dehydro-3-deoxygluconokinase
MGRVLCFGELLLRFAPDAEGEWLKSSRLPVYMGGAELNVAAALALWNIPVHYFSAVPQNFLGDQLVAKLEDQHIDPSKIMRCGSRVGTYYLEEGADVKNAGIVYDRAGSAFASLTLSMLDWDMIFKNVDWFHFSAICPALSEEMAVICLAAVKGAKERNITVSVDLNYRAKLWQYGKEPVDVIPSLLPFCDVAMGNIWAAEKMLGIKVKEALTYDREQQQLLTQGDITAAEIFQLYPNVRFLANTWRFSEAGIRYFASLHKRSGHFVSATYETATVVDKVGSGDCFMAGLIYGSTKGLDDQAMLDFATAAAFKKLFIHGDATNQSAETIFQFLKSS